MGFIESRGQVPFNYIYYDTLLSEESMRLRTLGEEAQSFFREEAASWSEVSSSKIYELGTNLLHLAEKEYQKEVQVLSQFYGLPQNAIVTDFYDNTSVAAKNLYANIMQTLQTALHAQSSAQNVLSVLRNDAATGKKESRGFKTSAAHLIRQHFINEFNKYISSPNFKAEQIAALSKKDAVQKIRQVTRVCLERAITKVSDYTGDDLGYGGKLPVFQELHTIMQDRSAKTAIVGQILKTFNIDTLTNSIIKDIQAGKTKKSKRQKGNYIGENLVFGGRGQVGGIQEALVIAQSQFFDSLSSGKNGTVTLSTPVGKGKLANTDFTYVTVKADVDIGKIEKALSTLDASYEVGATKKVPLQKMEEAVKKIDKITNGQFAMIQESTKAYVLGSNFDKGGTGFHGTTYGYEAFRSMLNRLNNIRPDAMLNTLLNLREGTVLGDSTKYRARAEASLATLFADMMFERPSIDIPAGNNIIYVFRLSGVILPLSYVLRCAGLAAQQSFSDLTRVISFKISDPPASSLLYRYDINYEEFQKGDDDSSLYRRWFKQRDLGRSEFEVSITFMRNFVALLNGDVKNFLTI